MGIKDYAKKKIIEKIEDIAFITAIDRIDKYNASKSLKSKVYKIKNDKEISTESFYEEPEYYRFTITEKIHSIRKAYYISDTTGRRKYIAKSDGLPKMPEIGLYDLNEHRIGGIEKSIWGTNPIFTLSHNNNRIASVHQKRGLSSKYEIAENGWNIEDGMSKATVYNSAGAIVVQVQYMMSSNITTAIVEFLNIDNEIPALLITLSMLMKKNG